VARLRFRDRFFTRPVSRAITSPLGIVLFGAGTAAGILLGLGLAAPLVGVAAWAVRVAIAIPRGGGRQERIDAYTLSEPWRQYVLEAQGALARFERVVATARPGPTRERLTAMASRLDDGLVDCWRIASRGDQLDAALATMSTTEALAELAELSATVRRTAGSPAVRQTMDALNAQIDAAERVRSTRQDAADRLRLLDARFDEIVARAVEVSLGTADSHGLDDDVSGLVTDLEALRLAIEEVDRASDRSPSVLPPDEAPGTPQSTPAP
jgi:hypothetical protein